MQNDTLLPRTAAEQPATTPGDRRGTAPGHGPRHRRRALGAAVAGLLLVGLAAGCSDEDGDGGTADEEVTELEQDADRTASTVADATGSAVTEVQQQVDEGAEESGEG